MATYVWQPGVGLVELLDTLPEARVHLQTDEGFDNLRASDGTNLTSRSKWKRYMRERGLTMTSDWKGTWAAKAKERADVAEGRGGDHTRRKEVLRKVMNDMSPRDVKAIGERARERHHQFGKEGLVFRGQ